MRKEDAARKMDTKGKKSHVTEIVYQSKYVIIMASQIDNGNKEGKKYR